ncbi:methylated-DNA-[protein]-cysteine S-methyltransferase [Paenibacillus shirakamiensis]|uniref:Methylated-DNA-[protein]-cysteine S-methyltransferase n=1 Tax=Paenibacillus shirakamiensis TaxID=1265935 RepID=A0ABS4JLQ5_9BACL|nr:methylated-DNA--[protein]-cysteine S-methyltransferase [Paenibacillus shirakamiensis]MBP2002030.1 methylated-DNA-[protein]-cysteine S-methyltransferase [Paenibacillus shirakamiensis]
MKHDQIHSPVFWTLFQYEDWNLHLAATEEGLCYVGSPNQPLDELTTWSHARLPGHLLIRDDERLAPYTLELTDYLKGARTSFTFPVHFRGTAFQTAVWQALCSIPYGQTSSYSEIAEQIARPAAVRAVGAAIGANPVLISVPCHRVIGKGGALTGYRGGLDMKTKLLELERK